MFVILFALVALVFGAVILFSAIFSMLPDWIKEPFEMGCSCLIVLTGLAVVAVPVILFVLWLIGTLFN